MSCWINATSVSLLACTVFALSLPLLVATYCLLKLKRRWNMLRAKILELHLEKEYLKIFHFVELEGIKADDQTEIRKRFDKVFASQFKGDNSLINYFLPFLLLLTTMIIGAYLLHASAPFNSQYSEFIESNIVIFAIAGSFLYIYPFFISRYSSLSLNPHTIYALIGGFWLSVMVGVTASSVVTEVIRPVAAFMGGLLPLPAIDYIKKRMYAGKTEEESKGKTLMLEILQDDRNLLSQLDDNGIRSVTQLAYENPIRIFMETDLNLAGCIDIVDQANLMLYVPEKEIRQELNRYGIRTAIDIMTLLFEKLPDLRDPAGEPEWRFLELAESVPSHMREPMSSLAGVMKLGTIESLRNLIQMMIDNPQLSYIHYLWNSLNEGD